MNETYFTSAHAPPEPHLPAGWRLMAFESLDSTNSALKRLVEQGAELSEGLLMWANTQTAGRGRAASAGAGCAVGSSPSSPHASNERVLRGPAIFRRRVGAALENAENKVKAGASPFFLSHKPFFWPTRRPRKPFVPSSDTHQPRG